MPITESPEYDYDHQCSHCSRHDSGLPSDRCDRSRRMDLPPSGRVDSSGYYFLRSRCCWHCRAGLQPTRNTDRRRLHTCRRCQFIKPVNTHGRPARRGNRHAPRSQSRQRSPLHRRLSTVGCSGNGATPLPGSYDLLSHGTAPWLARSETKAKDCTVSTSSLGVDPLTCSDLPRTDHDTKSRAKKSTNARILVASW